MKKQMKQIIVMILITAVLLCGCGDNESSVQEQKESETAQAVTEQETNGNVLESQIYTESKAIGSDAHQKGQELGDRINEKLESIDWEENYEKADEAGKKAAEWLNGLFE